MISFENLNVTRFPSYRRSEFEIGVEYNNREVYGINREGFE